jgi:hypothetical protein
MSSTRVTLITATFTTVDKTLTALLADRQAQGWVYTGETDDGRVVLTHPDMAGAQMILQQSE